MRKFLKKVFTQSLTLSFKFEVAAVVVVRETLVVVIVEGLVELVVPVDARVVVVERETVGWVVVVVVALVEVDCVVIGGAVEVDCFVTCAVAVNDG